MYSVSLSVFQPINGYRKLCFFKESAIAVHQLFNPFKGGYRRRLSVYHSPKGTTLCWKWIFTEMKLFLEWPCFSLLNNPFVASENLHYTIRHNSFHSYRSMHFTSENTERWLSLLHHTDCFDLDNPNEEIIHTIYHCPWHSDTLRWRGRGVRGAPKHEMNGLIISSHCILWGYRQVASHNKNIHLYNIVQEWYIWSACHTGLCAVSVFSFFLFLHLAV